MQQISFQMPRFTFPQSLITKYSNGVWAENRILEHKWPLGRKDV